MTSAHGLFDVIVTLCCENAFDIVVENAFKLLADSFGSFLCFVRNIDAKLSIVFEKSYSVVTLEISNRECVFQLVEMFFDMMVEDKTLLRLCAGNRINLVEQVCEDYILEGGNLNKRTAISLFKRLEADEYALFADNVHHIESDYHRNTDLAKLCCKIKITLKICSINDVDDNVRAFIDEIISRNYLFVCVRRERVNARKVCKSDALVSEKHAFLLFNSNARPVADVLI